MTTLPATAPSAAALAHLEEIIQNHRWISMTPLSLLRYAAKARKELEKCKGSAPEHELFDRLPDPVAALAALQEMYDRLPYVAAGEPRVNDTIHQSDVFMAMANAAGHLRGYKIPDEVIRKYLCGDCGASNVKLWRAIHSGQRGWCAKCAMAQAGYPDTVDDEGRNGDEHGRNKSDQIYNNQQGQNLLPFVPRPDGETWGYSSVPMEGCLWWTSMPTR